MTTRRNSRPLLSLWVLGAALLLHLGAPAVYEAGIMHARQIQHLRMVVPGQHEEEVMIIAASAFEQHFNREERELDLSGMRYDVISYHANGNMITCSVLKDEREQNLLTAAQHNAAREQTVCKFPLWFPVFYQDAAVFNAKSSAALFTRFCFPADEWRRERITDNYVSPPPELQAGAGSGIARS